MRKHADHRHQQQSHSLAAFRNGLHHNHPSLTDETQFLCSTLLSSVPSIPLTMYAPRLLGHYVRHQRLFSTSIPRQADFTHAVVGAGAVGLAVARQLQSREGASVALIEKHGSVGTETSSRNSEVQNSQKRDKSLRSQPCLIPIR